MLIYTSIKNASHLVHNGRVIPFTKQIANVPFDVQKDLVGLPHVEEFTGQTDLPPEFNDYAEGKVGDPVMEDFASTDEVARAQKKK
jgi:hypothetical protein